MSSSRAFLPFLLALVSAAALAAPAQAVEPGVVIGMRPAGTPTNVDEFSKPRELGARWVRLFMDWSKVEHGPGVYDAPSLESFDARIERYRSGPQPVNVLIAVVRAPEWAAAHPGVDQSTTVQPPRDPNTYASFIGAMAKRYAGKVQAWEVWNEQDEGKWWYPEANPNAYADLLKASAPRIRAADPQATIVVGGLTGANFTFVERLYDAGANSSFDAIGVHMDTACRVDSPTKYYREPDGRIGRFSYTGYREVRRVTEARNDPKPIWFTEVGWSTLTETCTEGAVAGTRPSGVSEAEQARFLREAWSCMAADSYVGPAIWFSLQDVDQSTTRYDHRLGLYRDNGTAKAAAAAFAAVAKEPVTADRDCGGRLDATPPVVRFRSPTVGAQYLERLPISVVAEDGETKVTRIELYANGVRIPGSAQGAKYDLNWLRARELPAGRHVITARAYDEGRNVGETSVEVHKILAATAKVPTTLDVQATPLSGRRVRVVGRLRHAAPLGFPSPKDRVRVFLDVQRGKRWKTISRFSKAPKRTFRITNGLKAKGGAWRVRVEYAGSAPYSKSRRVLRLRARS